MANVYIPVQTIALFICNKVYNVLKEICTEPIFPPVFGFAFSILCSCHAHGPFLYFRQRFSPPKTWSNFQTFWSFPGLTVEVQTPRGRVSRSADTGHRTSASWQRKTPTSQSWVLTGMQLWTWMQHFGWEAIPLHRQSQFCKSQNDPAVHCEERAKFSVVWWWAGMPTHHTSTVVVSRAFLLWQGGGWRGGLPEWPHKHGQPPQNKYA